MKFAIQCDKLQSLPDGDKVWSTLMAKAVAIPFEEFEAHCDVSTLLDEGETLLDFCCGDAHSLCYRSYVPGRPVYFFQTSGFEFFFTEGGAVPTYFDPADIETTHEIQRFGALATLLLDSCDGRLNGSNGVEIAPVEIDDGLEAIQGTDVRLRYYQKDEVVAGMKLSDGVITDIYVKYGKEYRRKGYATQMIQMAEKHFGPLVPSESQTNDGKAFFTALRRAKRRDLDDSPSP